ncbi:hypothetical protein BDR04DRAFT_1203746 [Suillus decipiens]|nr:hypothetical protein BDR04DRAFT_1203746 [Suillus decipiens]
MPSCTVSYDLKLHIPLRHVQGLSIKQICEVLGIQKSLVCQLKFTQTGPSMQSQLLRRHQLHQVPLLFTQFSLPR